MFDPIWLFLPVTVVFSAWLVYEHRRTDEQAHAEQQLLAAVMQRVESGYAQSDSLLAGDIRTINARLDQVRADTLGVGDRLEAHQHPHDHAAETYHVHWAKLNSTEVTGGIRRDVYRCLVPGCTSIISHTPEA